MKFRLLVLFGSRKGIMVFYNSCRPRQGSFFRLCLEETRMICVSFRCVPSHINSMRCVKVYVSSILFMTNRAKRHTDVRCENCFVNPVRETPKIMKLMWNALEYPFRLRLDWWPWTDRGPLGLSFLSWTCRRGVAFASVLQLKGSKGELI